MKLTYTEIKDLIKMTDRNSVQAFINGEWNDTNYEIRTKEQAVEAVYDSYRGDDYMLGDFNADFTEHFICLDAETIQILQKADAYENIGRLIMESGNFEEMMDAYIQADGFGDALSSYDGEYIEYNGLIIVRIN